MNPGEMLLVVQNFPPLNRPFIGKEVIPNHKALIRHFEGEFKMFRHLWYQDFQKEVNDNWFIGIFTALENML